MHDAGEQGEALLVSQSRHSSEGLRAEALPNGMHGVRSRDGAMTVKPLFDMEDDRDFRERRAIKRLEAAARKVIKAKPRAWVTSPDHMALIDYSELMPLMEALVELDRERAK